MNQHRRIFVFLGMGAVLASATAARAVAPAPPSGVYVAARTETAALIRWTPGAGATRGFKLRPSDVPGLHSNPTGFPGGRAAAFTWTTDDGLDDNLLYAPTFDSRGLHFTAFLNPSVIGNASNLTWDDVRDLHSAGHEMANHTWSHKTMIDDRALTLRYTGPEICYLVVANKRLRTFVGGEVDLDVTLTDAPVAYLSTLVAALDAHLNYEATLLFAPDTIFATRSEWLDAILVGPNIGLGGAAETLTTDRGVHDDAEMEAQILDAEIAIEAAIQPIDPTYACRTFAYPNHGHSQWSMSKLNELGYLGARSGTPGPLPFYSQGAFKIGFTTSFEVPHSFPRPSNAWTETQTRNQIAARFPFWKANHEWAVLMSHHEGEVDVQHLEWTIDEIASDPQIWIARFDEVMEYLTTYYTDVGYPIDPSTGQCSGWIHGLNPGDTKHLVVTAYNAALEESGWSAEILVPPFGAGVAAPPIGSSVVTTLRAMPNPFHASTTVEFIAPRSGPARVAILNLAGRRVQELDLGWIAAGPARFTWDGRSETRRPVASGTYWFRVETSDDVQTGRVNVVR